VSITYTSCQWCICVLSQESVSTASGVWWCLQWHGTLLPHGASSVACWTPEKMSLPAIIIMFYTPGCILLYRSEGSKEEMLKTKVVMTTVSVLVRNVFSHKGHITKQRWRWSLTLWPWRYHQCHSDPAVSNCELNFDKIRPCIPHSSMHINNQTIITG